MPSYGGGGATIGIRERLDHGRGFRPGTRPVLPRLVDMLRFAVALSMTMFVAVACGGLRSYSPSPWWSSVIVSVFSFLTYKQLKKGHWACSMTLSVAAFGLAVLVGMKRADNGVRFW